MDRVELLRAVDQVNVLDLAGAIITNPDRAMVSPVDRLALAYAVEVFWAMALEGFELARLHQRREFILSGEAGPEGDDDMDKVQFRQDAVSASLLARMAELLPQTNTTKQENEDGSRHS